MRLIIAEKPSQAGCGAIEGETTTITWCIGHLVGLAWGF